jgi:hypothetical protein
MKSMRLLTLAALLGGLTLSAGCDDDKRPDAAVPAVGGMYTTDSVILLQTLEAPKPEGGAPTAATFPREMLGVVDQAISLLEAGQYQNYFQTVIAQSARDAKLREMSQEETLAQIQANAPQRIAALKSIRQDRPQATFSSDGDSATAAGVPFIRENGSWYLGLE